MPRLKPELSWSGIRLIVELVLGLIGHNVLADRLPWLCDSNNSFTIVEAHLIHSLYDVLEHTDAGDQTFSAWKDGLANFVVQATSERTRAIGLAFQKFCERVDAMPSASLRGVDGLPSNAGDVVSKCKEVHTTLLPEIFTAMTEHFHSVNLQSKDWFVNSVRPGAVIPEADASNMEVLSKAGTFDLPCEELSCVSGMAETLKRSKIDLGANTTECQADFAKSTILVGACALRHAALVKGWTDGENPKPEELSDFMPILEKHLHHGITNGMLQLSKVTTADAMTLMSKQMTDVVMPTLSRMLKHLESLVNEAGRAMPGQFETWLSNRNIAKIKSEMLNRTKHEQICGSLEYLSKVSTTLQKVLDGLAAFGLPSQTDLSRFRNTLQMLKSLKTYSATVHGVNLLLFRLPKESQNRNKAALVRE